MVRFSFLLYLLIGVFLIGCELRRSPQSNIDPLLPSQNPSEVDLSVKAIETESPSLSVLSTEELPVSESLLYQPPGNNFRTWIEGQLARGQTVEQIMAQFGHLGNIRLSDLIKEDMNGDGMPESIMLVTDDRVEGGYSRTYIHFLIIEPIPLVEQIWLAPPRTTPLFAYKLAYHAVHEHVMGPGASLLTVTDISHDNLQDVLYHITQCGAHTCTTGYSLMSYHGQDEPREVLQSDPLSGHSPGATVRNTGETYWVLRDWNNDGDNELWFFGHNAGNWASGPQRRVIDIYDWTGNQMLFIHGAWEPTSVRYFRLRDGDLLIGRGKLDEAIAVLEEVARSEALQDTGWDSGADVAGIRDENADVRRFAYLRLVQAAWMNEDPDAAERYFQEMLATWPDHSLTALVNFMLNVDAASFGEACQLVAAVAKEIPYLTGALSDMGWSNPPITGENFCPVSGYGDVSIPTLVPYVDYDPAILP